MVVGHGSLQILQLHVVSLMLARNLVLEIVAIHPDSGKSRGCEQVLAFAALHPIRDASGGADSNRF
jgi:hypothetical protein